jgi:hypothetical protein
MYEVELEDLKGFEGSALRNVLRSSKFSSVFYKSEVVGENLYAIGVDIIRILVNNIEANGEIAPDLFRYPLFNALFQLGLNKEFLTSYIGTFFDGLINYIRGDGFFTEQFLTLLLQYRDVLLASILEYRYINREYSLNGVEEYKTSKNNSRFVPLSLSSSDRVVQTLFPGSRYWYAKGSKNIQPYSPLQFNKSPSSYDPIDRNKNVFLLSYEPSLVYENRVYLKKPDVTPTEDKFLPSEWDLYLSKRFDRSKSFNTVYGELLRGVYFEVSSKSEQLNSVTSDSKINSYSPPFNQKLDDKDQLLNSFGGAGRSIYEKLVELRLLSGYMGGHEGSSVGSVSYVSSFAELLKFISTGELSPGLKRDGYGDFNNIFPTSSDSFGSTEAVNGLRFLDRFSELRSFLHNQTLPNEVDILTQRISLNPIYCKFGAGIKPNYSIVIQKQASDQIDFIDQSLDVLVKRCGYLGDKLEKVANSLSQYGQLPGFETLGSISYQVAEFQKSFPPLKYLNETESPGGFTGAIILLKAGYNKLRDVLNPVSLPPSLFSELLQWMGEVSKSLKSVQYELDTLGIKTNGTGYLPNIETKKFISSSPELIKYLSFLGFRDSEIDQVLNVKTFPEFVSKFAPLSDSKDLKSFFRGYELSQLIYEFGGDRGIDSYLEFLYKKSPIDSLLNILYFTEKKKSDQTYLRIAKYPRLIALLMGLTYAVDPEQLSKFASLLGDNKLDLLKSITLLLQNGQNTIIKKKEDIDLLSGVIDQSIRGNYSDDVFSSPDIDYGGAKSTSAVALDKWTKLIGSSLGNVKDSKYIEGLYDKSMGLSVKELVVLLNNPSPTSGVGQIIDGFYGGGLTQVIKYANISGLAAKLGYYKNSSQLNNTKVDFTKTYNSLPTIVNLLDNVVESFSLTIKLMESATNVDWSGDYYDKPELIGPILQSQNKPPSAMVNLFSSQFTSPSTEISDQISQIPPQESPGIGNSRLPNRVSIQNSLTPEQAQVLSTSSNPPVGPNVVDFSANGLITKFIKVTERNLILNNISQYAESEGLYGGQQTIGTYSDSVRTNTLSSPSERDITLYKELKDLTIKNSGSGKNFLAPVDDSYEQSVLDKLPKGLLPSFDPVASCKKFGGSNCDKLYGDMAKCAGVLNKSFSAETYDLTPFNSGVVVDRPLGYFSEYLPFDGDIINSKIPPYYSILDSPGPGRKSEPLLKESKTEPMIFSDQSTTGDLVEYSNTEYALVEFFKFSSREYNELTCASLQSPHMYQMCMNTMKCKRFKLSSSEPNSLGFCPKGTSGGRRK